MFHPPRNLLRPLENLLLLVINLGHLLGAKSLNLVLREKGRGQDLIVKGRGHALTERGRSHVKDRDHLNAFLDVVGGQGHEPRDQGRVPGDLNLAPRDQLHVIDQRDRGRRNVNLKEIGVVRGVKNPESL